MAVDRDSKIVVSDNLNFRVQIFSAKGEFMSSFGKRGEGPGEFGYAKTTLLDSEGNICIVEDGNDRVRFFSPSRNVDIFLGTSVWIKLNVKINCRSWEEIITMTLGLNTSIYQIHSS